MLAASTCCLLLYVAIVILCALALVSLIMCVLSNLAVVDPCVLACAIIVVTCGSKLCLYVYLYVTKTAG